MATITSIRSLQKYDEMYEAVELQKAYWGNDLESVVPAHMLFSIATSGGQVIAAFDEDKMVAVLIGFLGTDTQDINRPAMANLRLISKRMIVLPEYRGQGVGYKLKKRQREFAMRQGIRLVTWTFDPLLAANAHLNIRKLAAISTTYLENYYGTSQEGGLIRFGGSDRLAAEWWVTNRRVEERLNGSRGVLELAQYLEAETPIVNEARVSEAGQPIPNEGFELPTGSLGLVEIPADIEAVEKADAALAVKWRLHIRDVFQRLFSAGYVVTDFLVAKHDGRDRAFYLFSQADKAFERIDFSSN
ncbi:MAG: GNAT family N-acetyltransferase [Chloroflexi bacterium]|nr:GNAT family N-acetyltransferase [Chloroflexota bacterium]MCC6896384.1 GNAT family N-acetyltransferase [Anaerolineae bacterium]